MSKSLTRMQKNEIWAFSLISPVVIYLTIFMLIPFCWAVWTSLTNKTIGTQAAFVGLANFRELIQDPVFFKSLFNTLYYTVAAVAGKLIFGLVMALVLNAPIPAKNFNRVLLFVPWTIPTLVSALTFKWMYSDVGGIFNHILMSAGIIHEQLPWLYDPALAMVSIIIANIWRGTPFIGISILAGLQTIPEDLYEAARIDGAGIIKRFTAITLPSIKEVIVLATLITTIWTFNDFEIVWLLTGGGPANSTQILSTYSYTIGFMNLNLSKAISASIFALPFLVILINFITKRFTATDVD